MARTRQRSKSPAAKKRSSAKTNKSKFSHVGSTNSNRRETRHNKIYHTRGQDLQDKARDTYNLLDQDHNGNIDHDEFSVAIEKLGLTWTFDRIERVFGEADEDGSGTIDEDEFCAIVEAHGAERTADGNTFAEAIKTVNRGKLFRNPTKHVHKQVHKLLDIVEKVAQPMHEHVFHAVAADKEEDGHDEESEGPPAMSARATSLLALWIGMFISVSVLEGIPAVSFPGIEGLLEFATEHFGIHDYVDFARKVQSDGWSGENGVEVWLQDPHHVVGLCGSLALLTVWGLFEYTLMARGQDWGMLFVGNKVVRVDGNGRAAVAGFWTVLLRRLLGSFLVFEVVGVSLGTLLPMVSDNLLTDDCAKCIKAWMFLNFFVFPLFTHDHLTVIDVILGTRVVTKASLHGDHVAEAKQKSTILGLVQYLTVLGLIFLATTDEARSAGRQHSNFW